MARPRDGGNDSCRIDPSNAIVGSVCNVQVPGRVEGDVVRVVELGERRRDVVAVKAGHPRSCVGGDNPASGAYMPDSSVVIVADVQVADGVESDSNRVIQLRRGCRDIISVKTLTTGAGDGSDHPSRTVDFQDLVVAAVSDVNVPETIDHDIGRITELVVGRENPILVRSSTTRIGRYGTHGRLGSQRTPQPYQTDKRDRPVEFTRQEQAPCVSDRIAAGTDHTIEI